MPRTPIPEHLIHRPEAVDRNAQRFDQLCRLVEEVALPVVRGALLREAATIGAEVFAEEAKTALDGILEEGALEGVEDPAVIARIRQSLECSVPEPDERECQTLTSDTAQILMSAWLEMLRTDLQTKLFLRLSEHLLPATAPTTVERFFPFIAGKVALAPSLGESMASLPVSEEETGQIMAMFRAKLFSEPRRVDLPFDLIVAGAPGVEALAMTQTTFERLQTTPCEARGVGKPVPTMVPIRQPAYVGGFVTVDAQLAMANLTAKMSHEDYKSLWREATPV